jgi:hypothetical protein
LREEKQQTRLEHQNMQGNVPVVPVWAFHRLVPVLPVRYSGGTGLPKDRTVFSTTTADGQEAKKNLFLPVIHYRAGHVSVVSPPCDIDRHSAQEPQPGQGTGFHFSFCS